MGASFVAYLGYDQVRIGDIQRRAILGKFHFQYVFPPRFTPKVPEEFKDVMTSNFAVANNCARSLVNHMLTVPYGPIRSKLRIIAAAILRVEPPRSNSHHALQMPELRLLD